MQLSLLAKKGRHATIAKRALTCVSLFTSTALCAMVLSLLKMLMEFSIAISPSSLYLKIAMAYLNRTLLPSYRKVSHIRSMVWKEEHMSSMCVFSKVIPAHKMSLQSSSTKLQRM